MERPTHNRDPNGTRTLPDLLGDLFGDVSRLIRQEVALARQEISEKITGAQSGAGLAAAGGALAFAGLIFLLLAATYGLSEYLHPAWSALIVGAVTLIIGFILLKSGTSKIKKASTAPERTVRNVRTDVNMIKTDTVRRH